VVADLHFHIYFIPSFCNSFLTPSLTLSANFFLVITFVQSDAFFNNPVVIIPILLLNSPPQSLLLDFYQVFLAFLILTTLIRGLNLPFRLLFHTTKGRCRVILHSPILILTPLFRTNHYIYHLPNSSLLQLLYGFSTLDPVHLP